MKRAQLLAVKNTDVLAPNSLWKLFQAKFIDKYVNFFFSLR